MFFGASAKSKECLPPFVFNYPLGFALASVAPVSDRKGGPFYPRDSPDLRQLGVNTPRKGGFGPGKSALLTLCLLPASSFFLLLLQIASRLRLCGSASLKFFITFHLLCGKHTLGSLIFSQEAVKVFTMQWG